ncbi:MAG: OmpA family protein [Acidimicrobiales bacterium]
MTALAGNRARSRQRRRVVTVLLAVNLALVGLNLAKRDVLPFSVPGLGGGGADKVDDGAAVATTSVTTAPGATPAPVVAAPGASAETIDNSGADWPGGPGPVPAGDPVARRATLGADGRLQLTGSAPSWAVATKVAQYAAEKLPGGAGAVDNLLTWHPGAAPEIQSGDVDIPQAATFAPGGAEIDQASVPLLDLAAGIMIDHPTVFAVVIGHTDDQGDEAVNAELASVRATAVVDYLIGKGVVPGQLVVAAAGEDDPLADNQTAEGRNANRRAEIRFKNFLISDATLGGRS